MINEYVNKNIESAQDNTSYSGLSSLQFYLPPDVINGAYFHNRSVLFVLEGFSKCIHHSLLRFYKALIEIVLG